MNKKGFSIVSIILILTGILVITGGVLYWQREIFKKEDMTQQMQVIKQSVNQDETANWKIYRNEKYGFEFKYPGFLKNVGFEAPNSILGTADNPVKGIYVGPLVFVINKEAQLMGNKEIKYYFSPKNPERNCHDEVISNQFADISYEICYAGSPVNAGNAFIRGKNYDIFVDGYSGGFDNQGYYYFGKLGEEQEKIILSTFKFIK